MGEDRESSTEVKENCPGVGGEKCKIRTKRRALEFTGELFNSFPLMVTLITIKAKGRIQRAESTQLCTITLYRMMKILCC